MPLRDRLTQLFRKRKQNPYLDDDEQETLYSPPERGEPDPEPSDFNVGQLVRAAGTAQAGAVGVADERRRTLPAPMIVDDGTRGVVRGVDMELLFVEFAVRTPSANWRKVNDADDPEFRNGDRLIAVGSIRSLDQNVVIPNRNHGTVSAVYDNALDVQVLAHFKKEDWRNTTDMGYRVWGSMHMLEVGSMMKVAAPVSYGRQHGGGGNSQEGRKKRIYLEMWYLRKGDTVAVNNSVERDSSFEVVTLQPGAKVLDLSEESLRQRTAQRYDVDTQALIAAVQSQASSIEKLTAMIEQFMSMNTGGYDAIRTEDRLIVLDPKALNRGGTPKRKRWMKASTHTAEDEPARGATHWRGVPIHVEHFSGDIRHPDGPFPSYVPFHYGYIPDTEASDGDAIDVIRGENSAADEVYLGVQKDNETGEFAQFKVLLDFEDQATAEAAMRLMWPDAMIGKVISVDADDFLSTVLPKLDVNASSDWGQRIAAHNFILTAGRKEQVLKKYPHLEQVLKYIIADDPSGNQKYLAWAANQLNNKYKEQVAVAGSAPAPDKEYIVADVGPVRASSPTTPDGDKLLPSGTTFKVINLENSGVWAELADGGEVSWDQPRFRSFLESGQIIATNIEPADPFEYPPTTDAMHGIAGRMSSLITRFHKTLPTMSVKDIMRFKSDRELLDAVNEGEEAGQSRIEREEAKGGVEKVIETDDYLVLDITNKAASCVYGKGTTWCLTQRDHDYFATYTEQHGATVHFVIDKSDPNTERPEKWALLHYPSGSDGENPEGETVPENGLRIYTAENEKISESEFKYSEVIDQLYTDWNDDPAEPTEVEVYWATYTDGEEPYVVGVTFREVQQIAGQDDFLRGNGFEVYRSTVSADDWDTYERQGDAAGLEFLSTDHVETIDPKLEEMYVLTHHGDDVDHRATVYAWAESEDELRKWVVDNFKDWREAGWTLHKTEIAQYEMDNESEQYWVERTHGSEEVAEHEPVEGNTVLIVEDPHEELYTVHTLGDAGWEPQAQFASEDQAQLWIKQNHPGSEILYRHHDGDVTSAAGGIQMDPTDPELREQQPLPGLTHEDTPRETKGGPSVGDYIVNIDDSVSLLGQEGPIGEGGLEFAQQHRQDQQRPNVPVWRAPGQLDDESTEKQKYEIIAGRKERMIEVTAP